MIISFATYMTCMDLIFHRNMYHLILIQSSTTIGQNNLAGAVSKLVERKTSIKDDLHAGCSSFPNPFAKMRLHWIGQEKRSEENLFESITTLVLGTLLECL